MSDEQPTTPNGEPNGPVAPPAETKPASGQPGPPVPPLGGPPPPSNVLEASPVAVQAALTGEPGTLPPTWCKVCQAEVKPAGKGRCPRCNTFLKLNFQARRHPINVLRRDQLYAEAVAEYRPHSLELRDACRYLANVKERLESTKDGTPEHQRLMAMWSELSVQLRSATSSDASPDIALLSTEQLIEKTTAILRVLLAEHDTERLLPPLDANRDDSHLGDAGSLVQEEAEPCEGRSDPTVILAPESLCPYCHRACVGPDHVAFEALHWSDPLEVARRQREADDVMRHQVGKPFPIWWDR